MKYLIETEDPKFLAMIEAYKEKNNVPYSVVSDKNALFDMWEKYDVLNIIENLDNDMLSEKIKADMQKYGEDTVVKVIYDRVEATFEGSKGVNYSTIENAVNDYSQYADDCLKEKKSEKEKFDSTIAPKVAEEKKEVKNFLDGNTVSISALKKAVDEITTLREKIVEYEKTIQEMQEKIKNGIEEIKKLTKALKGKKSKVSR